MNRIPDTHTCTWKPRAGGGQICGIQGCLDDAALVAAGQRPRQSDEATRTDAEISRLRDVLEHIAGGDNPCTDESKLRQWAYEALVLGRSVEELS